MNKQARQTEHHFRKAIASMPISGGLVDDLADAAYNAALKACRPLQAIADRLPKYADTGEAFVPGSDPVWIVLDGHSQEAWRSICTDGEWKHYRGIHPGKLKAYSTREAAEAAKETQG